MLADPRAVNALVDDFAAQWLNLRRVDEVRSPCRRPFGFVHRTEKRRDLSDRSFQHYCERLRPLFEYRPAQPLPRPGPPSNHILISPE